MTYDTTEPQQPSSPKPEPQLGPKPTGEHIDGFEEWIPEPRAAMTPHDDVRELLRLLGFKRP